MVRIRSTDVVLFIFLYLAGWIANLDPPVELELNLRLVEAPFSPPTKMRRFALLTALALALGSCNALANGIDSGGSVWREKYDALFGLQDFNRPEKKPMDASKAQQVVQELASMLKSSKGSIAQEERDEVEFWSKAANFKVADCKPERQYELQRRYRTKLPSFSVARPSLQVYLKSVNAQLVEYCVREHANIVLRSIEGVSAESEQLISSFGTEEYPPALQVDLVAAKLAPLYVEPVKSSGSTKRPNLVAVTKELYAREIGKACDEIMSLPAHIKDAVRFFQYNDALDRLSPAVKEWARVELLCELMPDYLEHIASLAPIQIRYKYQRM